MKNLAMLKNGVVLVLKDNISPTRKIMKQAYDFEPKHVMASLIDSIQDKQNPRYKEAYQFVQQNVDATLSCLMANEVPGFSMQNNPKRYKNNFKHTVPLPPEQENWVPICNSTLLPENEVSDELKAVGIKIKHNRNSFYLNYDEDMDGVILYSANGKIKNDKYNTVLGSYCESLNEINVGEKILYFQRNDLKMLQHMKREVEKAVGRYLNRSAQERKENPQYLAFATVPDRINWKTGEYSPFGWNFLIQNDVPLPICVYHLPVEATISQIEQNVIMDYPKKYQDLYSFYVDQLVETQKSITSVHERHHFQNHRSLNGREYRYTGNPLSMKENLLLCIEDERSAMLAENLYIADIFRKTKDPIFLKDQLNFTSMFAQELLYMAPDARDALLNDLGAIVRKTCECWDRLFTDSYDDQLKNHLIVQAEISPASTTLGNPEEYEKRRKMLYQFNCVNPKTGKKEKMNLVDEVPQYHLNDFHQKLIRDCIWLWNRRRKQIKHLFKMNVLSPQDITRAKDMQTKYIHALRTNPQLNGQKILPSSWVQLQKERD